MTSGSKLRLILARHGDTFKPGEKVYWVGARNDLELTVRGIEQARALNTFLVRSKNIPVFTKCGTLKRASNYARLATAHIDVASSVASDDRLNELDYGKWAGLTNDEIGERFGSEGLRAWSEHGVWPKNAGWPEKEDDLIEEANEVIAEIKAAVTSGTVLLVTSNGRARYLLRAAAPIAFESLKSQKNLKLRTGNISIIEFSSEPPSVEWDLNPETI